MFGKVCETDILKGNDKGPGIIVIIEDKEGNYIDVVPCCKGYCDNVVTNSLPKGCIEGWRDITDFTNPLTFMKNNFAFMNNVKEDKFSDKAYETYKDVLLMGYQYVLREPTNIERKQLDMDEMMF